MHYIQNPNKIQFELTTVCNALCLGCVRTDESFTQSKFSIPSGAYIDIKQIFKLLKSDAMKTVNVLEFCGTIDEPLVHPQFLELLEGIDKHYTIYIHTNAGLRTPDYYTKLAQILHTFSDYEMLFSLDGLEDTNHLYRQNVNWYKCIENAQAFINAGGNAIWQFIVFPWNEHQVGEAKQYAKQLGFKKFAVRHDRSFIKDWPIEKVNEQKEKPPLTKYVTSKNIYERVAGKENNRIECNNKSKGMYFVSYNAKLWPCCFLPNTLLGVNKTVVEELVNRIFKNYGEDFNSLYEHSADTILQHEFYTNDLVASWENELGIGKADKILRCVETCAIGSTPIGEFKWTNLIEKK